MTVPLLKASGASSANIAAGGTNVSAPFDVAAGSTVVVCACAAHSSGTVDGSVMTVTDSLGNTYTPVDSALRANASRETQFEFYYAAAHAGITITITYTTIANQTEWHVIEVPSTSATPVDVHNFGSSFSAAAQPGPITTTKGHTIVIYGVAVPNLAITYPAGYTAFAEAFENVRGSKQAVCWKELLATGTEQPTDSWTGSNEWAAVIGAYEISAGAPANTTPPHIQGTASLDSTVLATGDVWTNTPTSFARQWYRNGVAIAAATGQSYRFVNADIGQSITVGVIATNAGGSSAEARSAAVVPVALIPAPVKQLGAFARMTRFMPGSPRFRP